MLKRALVSSTVFTCSALTAMGAIPITASLAAADDNGRDIVVVTSQRREQDIQDVPIAISAFTAQALEERGVTEVAQLSSLAPNVTLDASTPFSGTSSVLSAYIRGIGQNDFAFNLDPGVGVYVDGVYLARTVGANADLLDVERVEVLKGPQGTLFGRNTIGGAVNIVTRTPGDEFSARADVTVGSYERMQVRGSIDMPLSDSLTTAFSFSIHDREGYQKRIPFPGAVQFDTPPFTAFKHAGYDSSNVEGGDNAHSARFKAVWDNGGPLTGTFSADITEIDQTATASTLLAAVNVPGPFAGTIDNNIPGTALDPVANSGFLFSGLYNFCIGSTPAEIAARNATNTCGPIGTSLNPEWELPSFASVNVDGNPDNDRLPWDSRYVLSDPDLSYANGNSFSTVETWGVNATLEYDLGGGHTVKSITSFRDLYWDVGMDLDGSPLNMLHTSFITNQEQKSQEFQLTGTLLNDAINYVAGVYYFQEEGNLHDFVTFSEGLLQVDGNNTLDTENTAIFGQIDWAINDFVTLQLGGRYTEEDKEFEGFQNDLNGHNYNLFNAVPPNAANAVAIGFPNPDEPLRFFPAGIQTQSFDNFSPRVGVQVFPADDIMVYASWSQGYKTGGWTTRLSNPLPEAPTFDEEEAESFEVGVKSRLFDDMLQLNAAAFATTYDGIQLNFQEGISPTIRNAGEAEINGAEVEVVAYLTDQLTINSSIGYLDATYSEVLPALLADPSFAPVPGVQEGLLNGVRLPKAPEWQFNIQPMYETPLPNGGELAFMVDYTHSSELWNDVQRTVLLERPATDVVNASITYREPDGNWELTFGGTNLTDERYLVTGQSQIAGGQIYGTYNRPTEWFATLRTRF